MAGILFPLLKDGGSIENQAFQGLITPDEHAVLQSYGKANGHAGGQDALLIESLDFAASF